MRSRRRTPAGGVQAEKQQRSAQLIAQGVTNSEACRLVGIDRKTGNRWRYGRKIRNSAGAVVIYPPVKIEESKPRSPRYLSDQTPDAVGASRLESMQEAPADTSGGPGEKYHARVGIAHRGAQGSRQYP